jgi:uncharacterized damage-inducible protein DinB
MMTERTFAPWVEAIATKLQESRTQIVAVARSIPEEAWMRPSPNQGWSYRDLLVHLAVGDWLCQTVLRAITTDEPLNIGEIASLEWISAGNAERLNERKERTVEELIAEVAAEGDETQELLARLAEADESRTQEDAPLSLGDYLRGFPGHDRTHLEELRTALE